MEFSDWAREGEHYRAELQRRIAEWPVEWENTARFVIYGDFQLPQNDVLSAQLGISLRRRDGDKARFRGEPAVTAIVDVAERLIPELFGAIRRVRTLIGLWRLVGWGNQRLDWWCSLIHGTLVIGRLAIYFPIPEVDGAALRLRKLPEKAQQKIERALFWIKERYDGDPIVLGDDLIARYTAYWNALECLIACVHILCGPKKLTKAERAAAIRSFISARGEGITGADIRRCYFAFVEPNLRSKAEFAFARCFGDEAERYLEECFDSSGTRRSLYEIRNSISHGSVDIEDVDSILEASARLRDLFGIVLELLGRILQVGVPRASLFFADQMSDVQDG